MLRHVTPITLAITGASGAIYGLRSVEFLLSQGMAVDVVCSDTACKVVSMETRMTLRYDSTVQNREAFADYFGDRVSLEGLRVWSADNMAAAISSGSYRSQGMMVVPCSMGALARIAHGVSTDLIARCADVCLKERFKLLLAVRESPLSSIHLENMLTVTRAGGMIVPAMPAFYHQPKSMDDLIDFVVGKVMDSFGLDHSLFKRWMESKRQHGRASSE